MWYNVPEVIFMYVAINGTDNNKSVYIMQSYRKENGKTSSRVCRKLGRLDELLERFSGNHEQMMAWAKQEADKDTNAYQSKTEAISLSLSQAAYIPKDEERSFCIGYLFLQQLCTELRLDSICRKISKRHKFTYDFHAILTDLVYARILSPSSKNSSYSYCHSLLEPPKYTLQNLYRALSVMAEESSFIQEELYRNSNFVHPRNSKILYYDCTNYYFEIEEDDELRRYGKSKEHRPNPIVTMGLFMDADGIPLAFDIFPGKTEKIFLSDICVIIKCKRRKMQRRQKRKHRRQSNDDETTAIRIFFKQFFQFFQHKLIPYQVLKLYETAPLHNPKQIFPGNGFPEPARKCRIRTPDHGKQNCMHNSSAA